MNIPFGTFAPDLPALGNPGCLVATNVLPFGKAYRPVSDLSAYTSSALNARCQGAIVVSDTAGNVNGFFGTSSKLYQLTGSSTAPADVSKVGGYSTGATERWSFAYDAANLVVATNGTSRRVSNSRR